MSKALSRTFIVLSREYLVILVSRVSIADFSI